MVDYTYDIAFSFLDQDEKLALNLCGLLKDRLNCFIYTEQQRKLAGTDGEKVFNSVFSKESRIVVILHRTQWGKTKWTRIEETAIKNRGYEDGYDFVLLVPLDDKPYPPPWYPKNRIWIGLRRWGIEGAASVIEARVQEFSGDIKEISIVDKIASIENEIIKQEKTVRFLLTDEGKKTAINEFKTVLKIFKAKVEAIKEKVGNWHIETRVNDQNGIDLLSYGYQLSIHYYKNTFDHYLFINLFHGYSDRFGNIDNMYQKAVKIELHRYQFDINKFDQRGWSDLKTRENFITTLELTEYWFSELMEYASKAKMGK